MARADVDYVALNKSYPRFTLAEVRFIFFKISVSWVSFYFRLQLKKFKEDFDLFDVDQSDDINVKEMQVRKWSISFAFCSKIQVKFGFCLSFTLCVRRASSRNLEKKFQLTLNVWL